MAENKESFQASPVKIELKGKPKGLTMFSKKFKMLIFAVSVICGVIVVAATVSNWSSASKGRQSASEVGKDKKPPPAAGQEQGKPRTPNFDGMFEDAKRSSASQPAPPPVNQTKPEAPGVGPANSVPAINSNAKAADGLKDTGTSSRGPGFGDGDKRQNGSGRGADGAGAADQLKDQAKRASAAVDSWNAGSRSPEQADLKASRDKITGALDDLRNAAISAASNGGVAGAPPQQQEGDDQNKQVRKETFLKNAANVPDRGVLMQIPRQAMSPYMITTGMVIPAAMGCAIDTDLPGQICARVTQNVYDKVTGKYLLIPQNTEVVGTYDSHIAMGQKRILVAWSRLQFQNGEKLDLQGMPGADVSGAAGFDADVDNHYGRVIGTLALASLFSAGLQMSQKSNQNSTTMSPTQAAASAMGQQLAQTGSVITQKQLQIQPTLSRERGYKFVIQVTKDIVFPEPYKHVRR